MKRPDGTKMHSSRLVIVAAVAIVGRDDALFIIVPLRAPARKNSISGDSFGAGAEMREKKTPDNDRNRPSDIVSWCE